MRYFAAAAALIGSGAALIITGVMIWNAADSFVKRGDSHFLFPSDTSGRIR
ncbi:MAG TPA: hypothetical protein VF867_06655 [Arthrobacter sp.]